MIEIKAKDLLKSDYQLLGEQHIKLQQENKQLKELLDKIYQYVESFIIDDEADHDCCEEEKHYIALELLGFYPKKEDDYK